MRTRPSDKSSFDTDNANQQQIPLTASRRPRRQRRLESDKVELEGREQAYQEGFREGLQEGGARLLLRQLEEKFGALAALSVDRVRAADFDQILEWGPRVLRVCRLSDVFGD
jgi:flagellar biosynthesis/type III secretory pathway protein FliH